MSDEQMRSLAVEAGEHALAGLPDRVRLPLFFDPVRLQKDLASIAEAEWTAHFVPENYEGEWSALPLRAPAGATHPILQIAANPGIADWQPTERLNRSPYFKEVLSAFRCDIGSVRLMRLSPGSLIREHRDERLGARWGQARLHIPVATGAGVEFRLNGLEVTMAAGETWYLRLADPHSVINRCDLERVHLVIDATINPWLAALLQEGAEAAV